MTPSTFTASQRRILRDFAPPPSYESEKAERPRILRNRNHASPLALFGTEAPELHPDFPLGDAFEAAEQAEAPPVENDHDLDLDALRATWQAEWEAEQRAELDGELRRAKSEAFQKGYAAARAELLPEIERLEAVLADDLPGLKKACLAQYEHLKPQLIELAVSFADALISEGLPDDLKAVSGQALADALDRFSTTADLEVALHPVDLMRLKEHGLVEQLEATFPQLRWHADAHLQQGEWVAQTPTSALRWLRDEQRDRLREHLGLAAAADLEVPDDEAAPSDNPEPPAPTAA